MTNQFCKVQEYCIDEDVEVDVLTEAFAIDHWNKDILFEK